MNEPLNLNCCEFDLFIEKEDPLEFWMKHEKDFPVLSFMAKVVLSVPASSAASEREFSKAKYVFGDNRMSLKPETAENITFFKNYFDYEDALGIKLNEK